MHLIPRYANDGTCRMVGSLIRHTDKTRYQIFVGILSKDEVSIQPLSDLGVEAIQFQMRHFASFSVIGDVAKELSARRIQVLHTHRVRPDIIGRIAGHRAGVAVNVSTQHYLGEWEERGRCVGIGVRFLYKRTLPYTQMIINISAAEMGLMKAQNVPPDKLMVIHNGVDSDAFFPEHEDREDADLETGGRGPVVGTVAFLNERKGIRYLVAAFRSVVDRFPDARLQIVGDGEERARLEAQIAALDLETNVSLLGRRADVRRMMNGFDVFVLPSLWEPFGLVIAEAMACGKPVVATHVGGIPEIVEHGSTGLLVPPAAAEPLADALITILANAELRHKLGRAGQRRFLERFDARIMAQRYEELYERLLQGSRS
jgi:glycosyltransferase involved in cell wall biosynthesis